MMKKITRDDDLSHSADLASQNVARLAELFPEAVAEGRVDVDVLRQLLGADVEVSGERFGLSWKGKAAARQLALQPSTGTLRPCPQESVDWDKTQNVFIEGDNLEVLKLLQKSYQGQVKVIYIDPPYNTGNDFVYSDDYQDGIRNYLATTQQIDEDGRRNATNLESSGRYHTNWLNMVFPRLVNARELLSGDGAIFISIDDVEQSNLRRICEEVFGAENFIAQFVWEKRTTRENRRAFSFNHEYILCFARSKELFEASMNLLPMTDDVRERYSNPDNDHRGPWQSVSMNAQGGHGTKSQFYAITTPGGRRVEPPPGRCWVVTKSVMDDLIADGRVWFGEAGNNVPRRKLFLAEAREGLTPHTLWKADEVGTTDQARKEVIDLFDGADVFDTPKPVALLGRILDIASGKDDIVLDFFCGSGTTAHAVMKKNADGGARRYILVQLPTALSSDSPVQRAATDLCGQLGRPALLSELPKERIRRAGRRLRRDTPLFSGDTGFRVYKLDSTNLKPWDPQPDDLERQLELAVENIKPGRTEQDILTELLLKLGLELTVPVEPHPVAGHTVYAVGGGALLACLSPKISRADVEDLAAGLIALHQSLKPSSVEPDGTSTRPKPARETTTVIFRDAAFDDDVAKANLTAILEQRGLHNLRSL